MAGLSVKSQIVWDKLNHGAGDLRGAPGNRHELAIFATKGRFTFHGMRPQTLGAFRKISPAKLEHTNEKPVDLMEWLVSHYCPVDGTVLDPFTGVSPVGVACVNTGRKFIGIEIDQGYFDIAERRIQEALGVKKPTSGGGRNE
jgi:site-specific DNA-methyltransferase (adenine-specific)